MRTNSLPMVVSQNFSSATSPARLAPIRTDIGTCTKSQMILEMRAIPPPSAMSKPYRMKAIRKK